MPELLSICIPTYNRAGYLTDMLGSLERALAQVPGQADDIRIYVSDNASPDRTPAVISHFARRLPLAYSRNPENIGGDRNFEKLILGTPGAYFWLIGDDDLVVDDVLPGILRELRPQTHGLVVMEDATDAPGSLAGVRAAAKPAAVFANYAAFVDHYRQADLWALIAHSLISKNVIKRTSFDSALHRQTLASQDKWYSHMYALTEGLARSGESVSVPGLPGVIVRQVGAKGGIPPWVARRLWRRFYEHLGRRYGHPELARYGRKLYGPRHQLRAFRKGIQARIKRGLKKLTGRSK
jgi:glycosyltransferase involved in cell wall biosynthesis